MEVELVVTVAKVSPESMTDNEHSAAASVPPVASSGMLGLRMRLSSTAHAQNVGNIRALTARRGLLGGIKEPGCLTHHAHNVVPRIQHAAF